MEMFYFHVLGADTKFEIKLQIIAIGSQSYKFSVGSKIETDVLACFEVTAWSTVFNLRFGAVMVAVHLRLVSLFFY